MPDIDNNINKNPSILVSRNRPLGFVVGVAGFLGSHLAEKLLSGGIQVIGIDDFSTGRSKHLENVVKSKDFHFLNRSIVQPVTINPPRLDYAFFVADDKDNFELLNKGLGNFLHFIKQYKEGKKDSTSHPKIVFVSSIDLYQSNISGKLDDLKSAEIKFAKFVRDHQLNARVVRLAPLYGPRMHFREEDPVVRLIQASLLGELQQEQVALEFSSRALYIDDAVDLILKTVFAGATASKIYDGALPTPIKIAEIKQILLDPMWHELRGFKPTELPPWPTPNLKKTQKELAWRPRVDIIQGLKNTISYFKDHNIEIPKLSPDKLELSKKRLLLDQSIVPPPNLKPQDGKKLPEDKKAESTKSMTEDEGKTSIKNRVLIGVGGLIIVFGLLYPVANLSIGVFNIRSDLKSSQQALAVGDFEGALKKTNMAKDWAEQMKGALSSLALLKRLGIFKDQIEQGERIIDLTDQGIEGVNYAASGMYALFKTTKIISGEQQGDPRGLYQKAQLDLQTASQKLASVELAFSDQDLIKRSPAIIKPRIEDLNLRLKLYGDLIDKAKTASFLLPQITALDGKKSYLVLLQNNEELRPTGGFIGSYAKVEFEGGKIKKIGVDDIYNLDGNLKEHIEPPIEIKNDLKQSNWYLRDSNFEPDFPSSAKQAEFFYNKEAGERVHGVIAMDLTASAKLIKAVGGLDLADYGEKITEDNLFERAISHAEVGFFPGSQAKKAFLTSLSTQLLNKIFFSSDQNWPAIITAMGESLEQKHLMLYIDDPQVFSYVSSQNWSGTLPRQSVNTKVGETDDFLAVNEANFGANKSNYYLERTFRLETAIGREKEISHHLVINYKNNSPSGVFPAGTYKNRIRIYLPAKTKLVKASFGEQDITSQVSAFSDYGRAGFATLIEVLSKEQKSLILDYQLISPLSFKDKQSAYRLNVIKQPGTDRDSFEWNLTYPINLKVSSGEKDAIATSQEINISTDLIKDRSFLVNFISK